MVFFFWFCAMTMMWRVMRDLPMTYVSVHKPEAYNMRKECLVQERVLICIARRGAEGVKTHEDQV